MKIIFLFFLGFFISINVFGQAESDVSEAVVEKISMARDDGNGNFGEETIVFFTTDVPIYCSIDLSLTKPVTVKMNFVAIEVKGLKAGKNVVSISYKTKGNQNQVNFNASAADVWLAGKYRVDILLDGKLATSQIFEIQPSPPKVENKNIASPKLKSNLKNGRKTRKN